MSVPDLVHAKKTQREKDSAYWEPLKREMEGFGRAEREKEANQSE